MTTQVVLNFVLLAGQGRKTLRAEDGPPQTDTVTRSSQDVYLTLNDTQALRCVKISSKPNMKAIIVCNVVYIP